MNFKIGMKWILNYGLVMCNTPLFYRPCTKIKNQHLTTIATTTTNYYGMNDSTYVRYEWQTKWMNKCFKQQIYEYIVQVNIKQKKKKKHVLYVYCQSQAYYILLQYFHKNFFSLFFNIPHQIVLWLHENIFFLLFSLIRVFSRLNNG